MNLAKCEFAKATVICMGRVVGQGQVRPVGAKVQAVEEFPVPTTRKELMRFLGVDGCYQSFCEKCSVVVAPLTDLHKGKLNFTWSSASHVCATPVLAAPRFDRPSKLYVDTSHVHVLLLFFFSKKFTACDKNYSVIEKETLNLTLSLKHVDVYVRGSSMPLFVHTNHNPLTFLNLLQCSNQRLVCWSLFFAVIHVR